MVRGFGSERSLWKGHTGSNKKPGQEGLMLGSREPQRCEDSCCHHPECRAVAEWTAEARNQGSRVFGKQRGGPTGRPYGRRGPRAGRRLGKGNLPGQSRQEAAAGRALGSDRGVRRTAGEATVRVGKMPRQGWDEHALAGHPRGLREQQRGRGAGQGRQKPGLSRLSQSWGEVSGDTGWPSLSSHLPARGGPTGAVGDCSRALPGRTRSHWERPTFCGVY